MMSPGIFELPIVPGYHIQKLFLFGKFATKKYVLTPLYMAIWLVLENLVSYLHSGLQLQNSL